MLYASKIKAKTPNPKDCSEVTHVWIVGGPNGSYFYEAGWLNDYITKDPGSVQVKAGDKPALVPAEKDGVKYVRSMASDSASDLLLTLPKS